MKHAFNRREFILRTGIATSAGAIALNTLPQAAFAAAPDKGRPANPALKAPTTVKVLFLDYREVETVEGFTRQLGRPVKYAGNPLFVADAPWENGNMQLYGSVIKAPGKPFQMWYSVIHKPWSMYLAYAESDDGLAWRRPLFDIYKFQGEKTNIVFADNPHGPAVIYDEAEPREDWRYKMVAGAAPTNRICAYHSADGIHWVAVKNGPILPTEPDCPMGFLRAPDGRYAIYHRVSGYGRRSFRSESLNFVDWPGESRMVVEPDAGDPPQIQCYGMGVTAYGPYELGTLWMYHTDPGDSGAGKMHGYQEAELTYARSGYAWHRAAQGITFIPHGKTGDWDQGNLQCASAPVFLEDEIRYYYMGTNMFHQSHWELEPQRAGLGLAVLKPDRFVGLRAGGKPAELLTYSLKLPSNRVLVNAATAPNGWIRLALLQANGKPLPGFSEADCAPITGDSTHHAVQWKGADANAALAGRPVRIRLRVQNAEVFSIYSSESNQLPPYHQFVSSRP